MISHSLMICSSIGIVKFETPYVAKGMSHINIACTIPNKRTDAPHKTSFDQFLHSTIRVHERYILFDTMSVFILALVQISEFKAIELPCKRPVHQVQVHVIKAKEL